MSPRDTNLHVRLRETEEKTAGGIILPDICRENWNEAEVLAAGPGMPFGDNPDAAHRSCIWAEPGDFVIFQKHHFLMTDTEKGEGVVRDEDLVAMVRPWEQAEPETEPCNDWVKLSVERRKSETGGGIALPERYRKKQNCGVILDYGPGKLRRSGKLAGTRVSVPAIMGIADADPFGKPLLGCMAYFGEAAEVVDLGSEQEAWVFVKAGDIEAVEEKD